MMRRAPSGLRRACWASCRPISSTTGAADTLHPVVDVAPLLDPTPDPQRYAETVFAIGDALRRRGYFYAAGVSPLPPDYIAETYGYLRRLHRLPQATKKRFASDNGSGGGYSGADVGVDELAYEAGSTSTVRSWDYSPVGVNRRASAERYPGSDVIQPAFGEYAAELYERQNELARALMVGFAEALELPKATFSDMFGSAEEGGKEGKGDLGTIRLLCYPGVSGQLSEQELATANHGISAHTDFEAFTLMHQDQPGLQFLPASTGEGSEGGEGGEGEWVDAPVRPGEFVVIVGDVLERFTNGVLKATPHKVLLQDPCC